MVNKQVLISFLETKKVVFVCLYYIFLFVSECCHVMLDLNDLCLNPTVSSVLHPTAE